MRGARVVGGLAALAVIATGGAVLVVVTRPATRAASAPSSLTAGRRSARGVPPSHHTGTASKTVPTLATPAPTPAAPRPATGTAPRTPTGTIPAPTTTATGSPTTSSSPATAAAAPTTATPTASAPTNAAPTSTATSTATSPSGIGTGTKDVTSTDTTLPPTAFRVADAANPNVAALAARLAPVVAADPGCLEVTSGSKVVFRSDDTALLAPGSTQKLLVAAAALEVLGPNYTFTTDVMAPAEPVNGVVSDLWLVGGGDPLLGTPAFASWWDSQPRYAGDPITDLASLAASVKAAGVTAVTGGVHGDDGRYDAVRLNPTWPADALPEGDITPMSALTLNEGYQSWTPTAVVPADPASFAAQTFAQLLGADLVNAPDTPPGADGTPPVGSVVIASIQSAPLSQIIGAMLRPSDNQIAELLVKELGYQATGLGTTDSGLSVVRSTDIALGIPWDGTIMVDGSGLDHADRTTCQTLLAVLYLGDRPAFSAIPAGMAVAGETGTLFDRFTTAPLAGHMHAKTGSIADAAGLVGEIDVGASVRFAMIFNQVASDTELLDHENDAVAAIAPYP